MTRSRKAVLLLLALVLALPLIGQPVPTEAIVITPMTQTWSGRTHGDFIQVGNGVMRCDPTAPPGSATACSNFHAGISGTNDSLPMVYADVDGNSATYNSSAATVTIPAGAHVKYAKLFWGGTNGQYLVDNQGNTAAAGCSAVGTFTYPPAWSSIGSVTFTAAGTTTNLTGAVTNQGLGQGIVPKGQQDSKGLYYSANVDVTALLSGLPSGSAQTITVGNIWTPQGVGCFGGWAIDIVYDYGQYVPGNADSTLKEIYQFEGNVRQFQGDSKIELGLTGINPQGPGARAGLIAFEGDPNVGSEVVDYSDPTTGGYRLPNKRGVTNGDFFISAADGAVPYAPNGGAATFINGGVDAYTFPLPGLQPGDTSFTLGLSASQDSYMLTAAMLLVPIASIEVLKHAPSSDDYQVILPGGAPTYAIAVYNTGAVTLNNIRIVDPPVPGCNRTIASMAPGEDLVYQCVGPPTTTYTENVVFANATTNTGISVDSENKTVVQVASMDVAKTANQPDVAYGNPGTFTITIRNTGTADLRNITVSDQIAPNCARTVPSVPAGQTSSYVCSSPNLTQGITNTMTATAQAGSPNQTPLTVPDSVTTNNSATIRVTNIALSKTSNQVAVRPGDQTIFTFRITNTGETALSDVAVTDPQFPTCARTGIGPIAPGANHTYTCAVTITQPVTNTAAAVGESPSGVRVTSGDSVRVETKAATIDKRYTTTDVNANGILDAGDRVTYTFVVTNTGSTQLTDVRVIDPQLTGVSCPRTTMPVGDEMTCTASPYTVTPADVQAGTLVNTATVRAEGPGGTPSPADDVVASDTETLTPVQVPQMTLSKVGNPTSVDQIGQVVTYTFIARNTGNVTLTQVGVTDTLPGMSAVVCDRTAPATMAPDDVMTCTATRSVTQADIIDGSIDNTATLSFTSPKGQVLTRQATASVTAIQRPALTLTKAASPLSFSMVGQTITYNMVATNTGNVPLRGVTIYDDDLSSLTCAPANGADLNPGQSITCQGTTTTTQTHLDAGSILNTARVTGTAPGGQVPSASADEVVTAIADPGLSVTKSSSRTSVDAVGQSYTYTIVATNSGNQTLTNVRVSDTSLPGMTALSCAPAAPATLAPGASVRCTATYTTTQADLDRGFIDNTATATGRSPGSATDNVTSTGSTRVRVTEHNQLRATKTVNPTTASVLGTSTTYTIVVTNDSNVTVSNLQISDPIGGLGPMTCTPVAVGGSLAPGATTTCTVSRTLTQPDFDAGRVTNVATVTATSPQGAPVSTTGTSQLLITQTPALEVTKTATTPDITAAGQTITYRIEVTNTGNVTLSHVTPSDSRLPSLSCTPAADASLAPTETMVCTGSRPATQTDIDAGAITNTASARAEKPSGLLTDPTDDVTDSDGEVILPTQSPAIDIEKTTTATTFARVGDTIPYTFTVRNTGNVTLNSVSVTDAMAGLSAISCPRTAPITLGPSEQMVCTATKTISQADLNAGSVTNSARAAGTTATNQTVADTSSVRVDGTQTPALTLTKSAPATPLTALGQTVTYSFAITNSGNQTLSDVRLSDPAVTGITCTPNAGSTLQPGGTMACTGSRSATQSDLDAGSLLNTATVSGLSPNLGRVSATDSEVVAVTQTPNLTLTKTANPNRVTTLGQTVTYTFVARNTGNVTAKNVVITDTKQGMSALTCDLGPGADLAPQTAMTCTATRSTTQDDLDAGSIGNTATVTGVSPAGVAIGPVPGSATVPVTQSPRLEITKSVTPTTATSATGSVSYSFRVTNTGNVSISNVRITDPLPGMSAIACTPALGGTLAPQAAMQCSATKTISQDDVDAGGFTNTATATGQGANGTTVAPVSASARVTIERRPDATFTKTASRTTVDAVGQVITYTFTATNTGDTTLTNLRGFDPMPGLSALDCDRPLTQLPVGEALTCTSTYTTTQADLDRGSIANTATFLADLPGGDPATTDDDLIRRATETVAVSQSPQFTVRKSSDLSSVNAVGQVIRYTITVTNSGNVTIRDTRVADSLIPNLVCTPAAGATLAPLGSMTCTGQYTVTQHDLDAGSIPNTATATGIDPGGGAVSGQGGWTVTAAQAPALTMSKTASPSTVSTVGQVVTFTFTVRNSGNVTLTDVTPTDSLPGVSTLTCTPAAPATLAPGATMSCTATRATTQADLNAGRVTNQGSVTATGGGTTVSATGATTVRATQRPELSLSKVASPTTAGAVGDVITYTLTATNTGNVSLTGVTISDPRFTPADLTCAPGQPATLDPGQALVCTASHTVTQLNMDAGYVRNTASATGLDPNNVEVPNPTASADVPVTQNPAITITKSASPSVVDRVGQIVTYTYVAENTGDVTLGSVILSDPQPGLSPATCDQVFTLAPGAKKTCTATRAVTQADLNRGYIDNTGTATSERPGGNPADTTDDITDSHSIRVQVTQTPRITLTKTSDVQTYTSVGQRIRYIVTATNTGNVQLTDISVSDPMLDGAWSCTPAGLTTLAPQASIQCVGTHTIVQDDIDAGSLLNSAAAAATGPSGTPVSATTSHTVQAVPAPALDLVKSTDESTFTTAGDTVTFRFVATNTGNTTMTDVTITDSMPGLGPLTCDRTLPASLAPGEQVSCSAGYTIGQPDLDRGWIRNAATATATDAVTGDAVSDTADTTITATLRPALTIIKSADTTDFNAAGVTITFTKLVRNTGNVTLTGLEITDPLVGLQQGDCLATDLAPGAETTCTGTYVTTQEDLDTGFIRNHALATMLDPNGVPVIDDDSLVIPAVQTITADFDKSVAPTTYDHVGEVLTYSFSVTNTGNVTIGNVYFNDPTPLSSYTCDRPGPVALAPGESKTCTATYTVTQADLNRGHITNTATLNATKPDGTGLTPVPSATATATADQRASFSVTKSANVSSYDRVGDVIDYTINVTNTGNVTLTNVVVDDLMGLEGFTCSASAQVAPGGTVVCEGSHTITQPDLDAPELRNRVEVTATPPSGPNVTGSDEEVVLPEHKPLLTVTKVSDQPVLTHEGQILTFTIGVRNDGNVTLTGSGLTDSLAGASTPVCTPALSTLAPGASVTCTVTYIVTQSDLDLGGISNTATATAIGPGDTPVEGKATVGVSTDPDSRLTLSKTANPLLVFAEGDSVTYTFTVTNAGNLTVHDVRITDPIGDLEWQPCDQGTSLAPGAQLTCTATRSTQQVNVDRGVIPNTATATGTDALGVPVTPASDSATVTVDQRPELTLSKSADTLNVTAVGQIVTYEVIAENTGNTSLLNVSVADSMLAGGNWSCTPSGSRTLLPGDRITCTGTHVVTQADLDRGTILNTATAKSGRPSGVPMPDVTAAAVVTATGTPELTLTKTADRSRVAQLGDVITYSINVINTGSLTMSNVTVTDDLDGLSSLTCTPGMGASLAPGASMACTATLTVRQQDLDLPSIDNSATARADRPGGDPNDPADDLTASDSTSVIPVHKPALSLTKTPDAASVNAVGDVINYTFVIRNTGNYRVDDVRLADTMAGLSTPSCTPALGSSLAIGATMTCTATYTVTQSDLDAGSVRNTATLTATEEHGDPISLPSASATVPVEQTFHLTLDKSTTTTAITHVGQVVPYRFVVTNAGNVTIHDVSITDDNPQIGTLSCQTPQPFNLPPTESVTCQADLIVTQANMDSLTVPNSAVATGTRPDGTPLTDTEQGADSVTLNVDATPKLDIDVQTDKASVSTIGEIVTFTVTYTNSGDTTLHGFTAPDPNQAELLNASCNATLPATLAPGDTVVCTAQLRATAAHFDAGEIRRPAQGNAYDPQGNLVTATGTAVVAALQTIGATITKTANRTNVSTPGEQIIYTFVIRNTGNVTITDLQIADSLPYTDGIVCPAGLPTSLAAQSTLTCTATHVVTQPDIDSGAVLNTATVSGSTAAGPLPATVRDDAVVTADRSPQLSLVKTSSVSTVTKVGDEITFTFRLTNTGNTTLTDVRITDELAGLGPITCDAEFALGDSLTPRGTATCHATYSTTHPDLEAGMITNVGHASAAAAGSPDRITDTDSVTVTALYNPELTMQKTVTAPLNWSAGSTFTYHFTVTNTGTIAATNVVITDPLPRLGPITCDRAAPITLEPGESVVCSAPYTADLADANNLAVANTASVTAQEVTGQQFPVATATARTTTDLKPQLTLDKTGNVTSVAAVGEVIEYSFLMTNTGKITVRGGSLVDTLRGIENLYCPPNVTLDPGGTLECTATYTVKQSDLDAGTIVNQATATATDSRGRVSEPVTDTWIVTAEQAPNLALTKTTNTTVVTGAGDRIIYTMVLTNTGNVTMTDAVITDPKPGVQMLGCQPVDLAPGESLTCQAQYDVSQAEINAGEVANTAQGKGTDPKGNPLTVSSPRHVVPVSQTAAIAMSMSANLTQVHSVDTSIIYTMRIRNTGNVTLNNVRLEHVVTGLEINNAAGSPVQSSSFSCPLPATLQPGQTLTCTTTYQVTQDVFDAGMVSATATVWGETPWGDHGVITDDLTDTARVDIPVVQNPSIVLSKRGDKPVVTRAGEILNYLFIATNVGNTTLSGLRISDPKEGLTTIACDRSTLAPGESAYCQAGYPIGQKDIDLGSIDNTASAVAVTPQGILTERATATSRIEVAQRPELKLFKRADTTNVTEPGQPIRYTFIVVNSGNVTMTGVQVIDPMPGLSDVVCAPGVPASLAPGDVMVCTASYVTTDDDFAAGKVENTAQVTGRDPLGIAITPVTSTESVDARTNPVVSLRKYADVMTVDAAGDVINYTFVIRNTSGQTLTDLELVDEMPGLGPITCESGPLTTLAAGASEVCFAAYRVTAADMEAGVISNVVTITGTDGAGQPFTEGTTAADVVAVPKQAIELTKVSDPRVLYEPNTVVTYTFTLTNHSTQTVTNPVIQDDMPLLYDWDCPNSGDPLAPGATRTCTAKIFITQEHFNLGQLYNLAVGRADSAYGAPLAASGYNLLVMVPRSDLKVTKTADKSVVSRAGEPVGYTITVENTGNASVNAIRVSDPLVPNLSCTGPLVSMGPGESAVCTGTAPVTQGQLDAGGFTNTVTVRGESASGDPTNPADDVVRTAAVEIKATTTPAATLSVQTGPSRLPATGGTLTYTLTVTNTGNVTLTEWAITGSSPLGKLTCPTGALAPGATAVCTVTRTVSQAEAAAGSLITTFTLTGLAAGTSGPLSPVTVRSVVAVEPRSTSGPSQTSGPGTPQQTGTAPPTGRDDRDRDLARTGASVSLAALLASLLAISAGALLVVRKRRDSGRK